MYPRQKGFTLIELLVAVSIIGLLSSIVITSLKEVKIKAINASVNVQVSEYFKALTLYKEDNGHYFEAWNTCLGPHDSVCGLNDYNNYEQSLDVALAPYISSPKINDRKIVLFSLPFPIYWRGVSYSCSGLLGGGCPLLEIHFILEGKTSCPRQIVANVSNFFETPIGESGQHTSCLYTLN